MHELSIALSLIDIACEAAAQEGAERVTKLHVRIGAISGIVKDALLFSFDIAAEGTACEGATLEIEDVGLLVLCPACDAPKALEHEFDFRCPTCGAATPTVLAGRELELVSLEVENHASAHSRSP